MHRHGEASKHLWTVTSATDLQAEMFVDLPLSGLRLTRRLRLPSAAIPAVVVDEALENLNPQGRLYNMVQHPSIGSPFLDPRTIVDANATEGFAQAPRIGTSDAVAPPLLPPATFWFPTTSNATGTATELRTMQGSGADDVSSYVVPAVATHGSRPNTG